MKTDPWRERCRQSHDDGHRDITMRASILAAAMYWAAFSPLRLTILAWCVPIAWTYVILQPPLLRTPTDSAGIRGAGFLSSVFGPAWLMYLKVWGAGALFWLAAFSWVGTSPAVWAKAVWLGFSFALAGFWCAFTAMVRFAVWRLGVPVLLAAPTVWCVLEWVRKNWFFGGFGYAGIEHTQYRNLYIIQIADVGGEYAVAFVMLVVGAGAGRLLSGRRYERAVSDRSGVCGVFDTRAGSAICAVLCLSMALGYGALSTGYLDATSAEEPVIAKVALLQGSIDSTVGAPPEYEHQRFSQYRALSKAAGRDVDLVVWPEESCPLPFLEVADTFVPEGWESQSMSAVTALHDRVRRECLRPLANLASAAGTGVLLGIKTSVRGGADSPPLKNSALYITHHGKIAHRYDKVHLAPFLEYDPIPWLNLGDPDGVERYSPGVLSGEFVLCGDGARRDGTDGASAEQPREGEFRMARFAVNICYESSSPRYVRSQVNDLLRCGRPPDAIINMSDDGSSRFRSMIDMHLATHVFRAVENRRPYLSADNAGCSVWIGETGRIIKEGKRGSGMYVIALIRRGTARQSIYQKFGDWLPYSCLVLIATTVIVGSTRHFRRAHWG